MSSESAQPTIFLSYAHGDHAQAQRLAAALQRGGCTVWWDALIEGGTRYAATIDEALETADAVVVLWSKRSVESDWVRDEAAQGRERHRLVPLSLDGTHPPLGFRQIQMIDISGWNGRPMRRSWRQYGAGLRLRWVSLCQRALWKSLRLV